MSVSCGGFKAKMVAGCEMIYLLANVTRGKESSSDNYVEAMEACSYKECGAVNSVRNSEGGFRIF